MPASGGFNPVPRRPHTRSYTRGMLNYSNSSTEHASESTVSEDTYVVSGEVRPYDSNNFKASGVLFYRRCNATSKTTAETAEGVITYEGLVGMHAKKNCITLLGGKRATAENHYETASREFFEETGALLSSGSQVLLTELLKSPDDSCLKCWLGRASTHTSSNNCKYVLYMINMDAMDAERYRPLTVEVGALSTHFASNEGSEVRSALERQFREMKSLHFISFDSLFKTSGKRKDIIDDSSSSAVAEELKFHRFISNGVRENKIFVALATAIQTVAYDALVASYKRAAAEHGEDSENPSVTMVSRELDELSIKNQPLRSSAASPAVSHRFVHCP